MGSIGRVALIGHLLITVPVIVAMPLVVLFGSHMFGPMLIVYYLLAGLTICWQWYSRALPSWKEWLHKNGFQDNEIEQLAHQTGLTGPGASSIGLFAFHTTAVATCAIHLGPWLVSRWFVWILPLAGMSTSTLPPDHYLQHLELMSVVPALGIGYLISRRLERLATWAWILPTTILAYKLSTFADPSVSVLFHHSSSRFSYFFVIERFMPTFSDFRGASPVRVAQQMFVVAPFYSGMAYSIGALAAKHNVLGKFIGGVQTMETGRGLLPTGEAVTEEGKNRGQI